MTVEIPQHIKRAAVEELETTHWDGNGCGTHDVLACSRCYGPSPASADEVVDDVLAAVWPLIETHVREQVAGEIERLREAHFQEYGNEEPSARGEDWGYTYAAKGARGAARDGGSS